MKQRIWLAALIILVGGTAMQALGQTALPIPSALSGTVFNLTVQTGSQQFYPPVSTPTLGVNGPILAPTLILNKGDVVTLNVTNTLNTSTTMHWHGMHVPAEDDGGPHQLIPMGTTWSPSFEVMNNAGTFWYHPHGEHKTDLQVSRGIAGMIIVRDNAESLLDLPRTYGVDDIPVIVQTKAFDLLQQIAISTEDDTALFVNGALHTYLDAPAQVVRLRLLNGSSMRTYLFGLSGNQSFTLIGTDAGLLDSALTQTRIRLSPGERAEILLDLGGMTGQILTLRNYGSELPDGIYGALNVGSGPSIIPTYSGNPLNGADYDVLPIHVVAPTANPVTTLPSALVPNLRWDPQAAVRTRTIRMAPLDAQDSSTFASGPFAMNGLQFDMDSINSVSYLNDVEVWRLENETEVAHPFHIHDMHFFVTDVGGGPVPAQEAGKKDVVLVMPHSYVEFVTRFEDFANDSVPYMYHCHLLHHEDDGMMGSLLVVDTLAAALSETTRPLIAVLAPNPSFGFWTSIHLEGGFTGPVEYAVMDIHGVILKQGRFEGNTTLLEMDSPLAPGMYCLRLQSRKRSGLLKWMVW